MLPVYAAALRGGEPLPAGHCVTEAFVGEAAHLRIRLAEMDKETTGFQSPPI